MTTQPGRVWPQYEDNCFIHIPALLQSLLAATPAPELPAAWQDYASRRYRQVVFVLVDAFGWRFFERFSDGYPLLQRLRSEGTAVKLTSQFPSTTAAHVTTLATGLSVGQHGVYEWQYYEPRLDTVIVPLMFSYAGDKMPETLQATGIDIQALLPQRTFFQQLAAQGVRSLAFAPKTFAFSSYTTATSRGAEIVPYGSLPEALVNLRQALQKQPASPTCHYLYFGDIDATCHHYGPESPQLEAEIDAFLTLFERNFFRPLAGRLHDTLLVIAADHGQTAVDPKTAIYINRLRAFKQLQPMLLTNRGGHILPPGGSPRDVFLYVKTRYLDEAQALLQEALQDRAEVTTVQALIDQGLFGPEPVSQVFRQRVGAGAANEKPGHSCLVILPHAHESVWWYERGRFEQKFYGHHGGLTPDEMEIPLVLYDFAR